MIDWNATEAQFGYSTLSNVPYRAKIIISCDLCGHRQPKSVRNKTSMVNGYPWKCGKCRSNQPTTITKLQEASKKLWADPEYRSKNLSEVQSESNRQKLSNKSKDLWKNKKYRDKSLSSINQCRKSKSAKEQWQDEAFRDAVIESSKGIWTNDQLKRQMLDSRDPAYRLNQRKKALKNWSKPDYINKQNSAIAAATRSPEHLAKLCNAQCKVSSLAEIFYSILDDLGVQYYREYNDKPDDSQCHVANYSFDCVIPRSKDKTLLIDINGEWVHSRPDNIRNDRAKSSYIVNNLSHLYELKYIWEYDLACPDKIRSLIRYWLDIEDIDVIDYDLSDIVIKKSSVSDYKLLLSKYHYLSTAGRGGLVYGAYLNDDLIAVAIFSPPPRQNHKFDNKTTRDLSRFCIHPSYRKINLGSWFLSKCITKLNPVYKTIISFCDTTYNHDGVLYKASNFILDGEVKPDYWYVGDDGWVMHKKTLYNKATKMHMKEKEYAQLHKYHKVWGCKKLRFVYCR